MDTLCPDESVSSAKRKRVIVRKLVEGHEAATQLKLLVQKPSAAGADNEGSLSVDELVANVQRSFTECLSVLTSNSAGENGSLLAAASGNDPRSEDSGEGRKRSAPTTKSGGRGCYNRRRNAQSWTIVSPPVDDHHAWRKYGQKDILNSKFPRSYYRCTRKYDQGCRAAKQVQMTQENPEMYQTTYIGIHTCKATTSKPRHLVTDSISPPTPIINQENSDEGLTTPGNVTYHHKLDPSIWSDLKDFEPSKPSLMASDHNVADTSVYSQNLQDMDFGTHDFHFDDSHELL